MLPGFGITLGFTVLYLALVVLIPLLGLFVLAFGWIEDVAAKRSPRLFPYPRKARGRRRAAG